MNPATSVSFYKPIFNDFLYAPVDAGLNGNPLSVLSALARLDVDPWREAAELAELSRDGARRRLAELLERLPGRPWVRTEAGPIADRLVKLLPRRSLTDVPMTRQGRSIPLLTLVPNLRTIVFVAAIGVCAIAFVAHRESVSRSDLAAAPGTTTSQPSIP